jgi:hypothetical protein
MNKKFFPVVCALLLAGGGIVAWKYLKTSDKKELLRERTTVIEVLDEHLHFGTFDLAETREGVYEIKNKGENPLIILDVTTSCNCTEIAWPRKPVPPGDTARIRVTYTPNERGRFSKTIDLYCNTSPRLTILRLDGHIE